MGLVQKKKEELWWQVRGQGDPVGPSVQSSDLTFTLNDMERP